MASVQFLEISIAGDNNLLRNFDQFPSVVQAIILQKMKYWMEELEDEVQANIRERLDEKTGNLLRSVKATVVLSGKSVKGQLTVNHKGALAQEKGAIIPPHIIRPRNAKILRFWDVYGQKRYALRVFHPGAVLKAKYFVRDARKQVVPLMMKDLKKSIVDGLRRRMRGQS